MDYQILVQSNVAHSFSPLSPKIPFNMEHNIHLKILFLLKAETWTWTFPVIQKKGRFHSSAHLTQSDEDFDQI